MDGEVLVANSFEDCRVRCILRIAVAEAKLGVPTTDIGQIPGGGSTEIEAECPEA